MSKLKLTLACPPYDRTLALRTGEIQPEGIDLNYVSLSPAEVHQRMLKNQEFDASEMSVSFYLIAKSLGKANYTGIPIFPMRTFFHTQLVVNSDSGIKTPSDFKGKRVGIQEYGMTLALWLRGILLHEFGVAPQDVNWYLERSPGKKVGDSIGFTPPAEISITQVKENTDLMTMLYNGEIDAGFPYPMHFKTHLDRTSDLRSEPSGKIVNLFPDPKAEAIRYYKKTKLFPINHVIVVKDEILKQYPWVALNLYDAFAASKELSYRTLYERRDDPTNLIFQSNLYDEVRSIFGEDPFPYGLTKNKQILEAMISYSHEQGLIPRKLGFQELFASTTLGT